MMSRVDKKQWLGLHVCGTTFAEWYAPPRSNRKCGLVPVLGTCLCKCIVLLLYFYFWIIESLFSGGGGGRGRLDGIEGKGLYN